MSVVDSWNIWKGSINAEEHMEVSEQHLLHPDDVSVREDLEYFSKMMLNHRLHHHHNSLASQEKSPGPELVHLQSRPLTQRKHHKMKGPGLLSS